MNTTNPKNPSSKVAGISADAVRRATGRDWAEWCALLDQAGARKMTHQQIVAIVSGKFRIGSWWQQMITVGYEQARGLRQKHQKPEGFEISGSKTVAVPLAKLFTAWHDDRQRRRWLADADFTVRKATPNKSLRLTWGDGKTSVDVNFYAKGDGKSQVSLNHGKLPNVTQAARMKKYWAGELAKLRTILEDQHECRA
ncbi:MAG: hypothetical protein HYY24_07980 [Verrucomicrobia bacterium]|nr:hypothetical protein [Verrucomicrobiota bacterium]